MSKRFRPCKDTNGTMAMPMPIPLVTLTWALALTLAWAVEPVAKHFPSDGRSDGASPTALHDRDQNTASVNVNVSAGDDWKLQVLTEVVEEEKRRRRHYATEKVSASMSTSTSTDKKDNDHGHIPKWEQWLDEAIDDVVRRVPNDWIDHEVGDDVDVNVNFDDVWLRLVDPTNDNDTDTHHGPMPMNRYGQHHHHDHPKKETEHSTNRTGFVMTAQDFLSWSQQSLEQNLTRRLNQLLTTFESDQSLSSLPSSLSSSSALNEKANESMVVSCPLEGDEENDGEENSNDRSSHWQWMGYRRYSCVAPSVSLQHVIESPLHSYELFHDGDQRVRSLSPQAEERRTRRHVGTLAGGPSSSSSLNSSFELGFAHVLVAVVRLADRLEGLEPYLDRAHPRNDNDNTTVDMDVDSWRVPSSFRTRAELELDVRAQELEAALAHATLLSVEGRHALRTQWLVRERHRSDLRGVEERAALDERLQTMEVTFRQRLQQENARDEFHTDLVMEALATVHALASVRNETRRRLSRLNETARSEAAAAKARVWREAALERADEHFQSSLLALVGEEQRKQAVETVRLVFAYCSQLWDEVCRDPHKLLFFALAAAALTFAVVTVREVVGFVFERILRNLRGEARLVREYGNIGYSRYRWPPQIQNPPNAPLGLDTLVLDPVLNERLRTLCDAARKAHTRGSPHRHVLLYGPPGCGKTTVAKALASSSGLPYAVVGGSDFAPLGRDAPLELRHVLEWVFGKRGRGPPKALVIDEADLAFASRAYPPTRHHHNSNIHNNINIHNQNRYSSTDVLHVMLSLTGGFSRSTLIFTSTYPHRIDEAILDRVDELVDLGHPLDPLQRKRLLRHELPKFFDLSPRSDPPWSWSRSFPFPWPRITTTIPVAPEFDVERAIDGAIDIDIDVDNGKDSGSDGSVTNFRTILSSRMSRREVCRICHALVAGVYASSSSTEWRLDATVWNDTMRSLQVPVPVPVPR